MDMRVYPDQNLQTINNKAERRKVKMKKPWLKHPDWSDVQCWYCKTALTKRKLHPGKCIMCKRQTPKPEAEASPLGDHGGHTVSINNQQRKGKVSMSKTSGKGTRSGNTQIVTARLDVAATDREYVPHSRMGHAPVKGV